MAALAVAEGGDEDPLVEVGRGGRRGEAAEEGQEPRGPADLGGAGRAVPDVGRQAGGVERGEVVHEERVDETARLGVLKGLATDRRVAHTLYMAERARKVAAGGVAGAAGGQVRAPERPLLLATHWPPGARLDRLLGSCDGDFGHLPLVDGSSGSSVISSGSMPRSRVPKVTRSASRLPGLGGAVASARP
jgi:hypothetical protein